MSHSTPCRLSVAADGLNWRAIMAAVPALMVAGISITIVACGSSQVARGPAHLVGALIDHPDAGAGRTKRIVVDPNHRGQANSLSIVGLSLGRLVDVYDEDFFF